jgi:hypothetical protein
MHEPGYAAKNSNAAGVACVIKVTKSNLIRTKND